MKTSTIRNFVVLLSVFLSGSCFDYKVTTTVNQDGSIFRKFEVRCDSSEVFKGSLMIPSGPDWKISHEYTYKDKGDTLSEKSQYVYIASKTFGSVGELNTWISEDTSTLTIKPVVSLRKRFRWFYTYFDYTETYPMVFPFKTIPVDSFLAEIEQAAILEDERVVYDPGKRKLVWRTDSATIVYTHSDSAEMKNIFSHCEEVMEEWMGESIVMEYLNLLNSQFREDPAVQMITRNPTKFRDIMCQKFRLMSDDSISAVLLSSTADSIISSNRLSDLCNKHPDVFRPFDRKFKEMKDRSYADSYTQILNLPGIIYSTNAKEVKNSGMTWEFSSDYYFMKDFEMKASSRVPNPYIMGLTGLIALMLIIRIIFVKRR